MSGASPHPRRRLAAAVSGVRLLITILSALLLLLAVVAWALGYPGVLRRAIPASFRPRFEDPFCHHTVGLCRTDGSGSVAPMGVFWAGDHYGWAFFLNRGQLGFHALHTPPSLVLGMTTTCGSNRLWYLSCQGGDSLVFRPPVIEPVLSNAFGFGLSVNPTLRTGRVGAPAGTRALSLHMPLWFPTVLLAASTYFLYRSHRSHVRARRALQSGVCPTCHYDLRAHLAQDLKTGSADVPNPQPLPPRCPECGTPIRTSALATIA